MRVNIVNQGGYGSGGFDIDGSTLTGPLILAGNPTAALEAATKSYVDTAVGSLNTGHISTGTLPVGRLPAFSGGDFSNVAGTNIFTLANTSVTPGTYPKVTVNAQGRVTAGASLVAGDIPALDWSKIVNNKPTTLDGYGILDGVKNTTDSVTGFLTAHAAPTANTHAATKAYVDSTVSSGSSLAVGDTIRRTSVTTPTGFLRCNGGQVGKTTYAALYAVVGDVYTASQHTGAGQPWRQQYDINLTQSENMISWGSSGAMPAIVHQSCAIVTKNRIYVFGGSSAGGDASAATVIYTSILNADGTVGAWTTAASTLPTGFYNAQAIVTVNRIYLISNGGAVYYNTLNSDGLINPAWTQGPNLPASAGAGNAFITLNRVFYVGINTSTKASIVYSAPIDASGVIGTWVAETNVLPVGSGNAQCAVTRNRVYIIGGWTGTATLSATYTAAINSDGTLGTWTAGPSLPVGISNGQSIVTRNRVYLLGGYTNTHISTIYAAVINADGTLGAWATAGNITSSLYDSTPVITNNRVYLIGGSSSNYGSMVYTSPITGGLNDYTPYYNGSFIPVAGMFRLPDTTNSDPSNIFTFIKF